jgi:hypothetical protein
LFLTLREGLIRQELVGIFRVVRVTLAVGKFLNAGIIHAHAVIAAMPLFIIPWAHVLASVTVPIAVRGVRVSGNRVNGGNKFKRVEGKIRERTRRNHSRLYRRKYRDLNKSYLA